MKVWDCESVALPLETLKRIHPEFDPDAVKLGNIKDPEKARAKIDEARASFWDDVVEAAPLDARYSQCVCVCFTEDGDQVEVLRLDRPEQTEAEFLNAVWLRIEDCWGQEHVGFNSNHFDIAFLIRRSWLVGAVVPPILDARGYPLDWFIDLLDCWRLGDRQLSTGGLNQMLQAFGLPLKTGDGKEFGKLWATDRVKAIEYARQDVVCTWKLAQRILPMPVSRQKARLSAGSEAKLQEAGF